MCLCFSDSQGGIKKSMGEESEVKKMFEAINKIERLLTTMKCRIDWIQDGMISVDYGLWYISIEEDHPNDIFLNLHVDICPWKAADIAKRLSYLADSIDMNVVIQDVYAFEFDQAGDLIGLTYGGEAYKTVGRQHYYGMSEYKTSIKQGISEL
jgi:hypothetical protein